MPLFDQEALQRAILNTPQDNPQTPAKPTPDGAGLAPYLALFAGQGADAASTAYNFSRGYKESNPMYGSDPSLAKILAVKAGMAGGLGLLIHHLASSGHPDVAKILGYIGGVGGAIPAAINMSQK